MELKKTLIDLLKIKSYTGEEKEISNHIYNLLEDKGYFPKKIENNIICSLNENNGKNIALVGHLDTIRPEKENKIKEENGKIHGLGSVDMKSGLACMLKTIEDIEKIGNNLTLYFYTGEEGPLPNGINTLLDSQEFEGIDLAIILEPTNSEIELGCLGTIYAEYNFKGKASHSAFYWRGENSIYNAIDFIRKVKNIDFEESKEFKESMNITNIKSSGPDNQIPEKCSINVNFRFSPYKSLDEAKRELREKLGEPDNIKDASAAAMVEENSLIKNLKEKRFSQFWTDIAQLNNAGIPTINFGPGNPVLAHSPNEHIKINKIQKFYEKMIDFINN